MLLLLNPVMRPIDFTVHKWIILWSNSAAQVVFNLEYSFNVLLSRPINALHQFLASTSTVSVYNSLYSVIAKAISPVEYVQC